MMQPLEIVPYSEDSFYTTLSNDHSDITQVERHKVARYLHQHLYNLGAKTIVVEPGYVDYDFLDAYVSYYARSFRDYDRYCKRIHFFAKEFEINDFIKMLAERNTKEENTKSTGYLGYIVARPLSSSVIGRTILVPDPSTISAHHIDKHTIDYTANLFGLDFTVEGIAFQEQDNALSQCATVVLWVCLQRSSILFQTLAPTIATISRTVSKILPEHRALPAGGLNAVQVCSMIQGVGLEPDVISITPNWSNSKTDSSPFPWLATIYGYGRLGITAYLSFRFAHGRSHAVAVVGYSMASRTNPEPEGPTSIKFRGHQINLLHTHDDVIGPYVPLQIRSDGPIHTDKLNLPEIYLYSEPRSEDNRNVVPTKIVFPVHPKVRVAYLDVYEWLYPLHSYLTQIKVNQNWLEWDLYLITTNKYKQLIKDELYLQDDILRELLIRQHPRFIWRAVLDSADGPVLELLIDATDSADKASIWCYQIIWHSETMRKYVLALLNTPGPEQEEVWHSPVCRVLRSGNQGHNLMILD